MGIERNHAKSYFHSPLPFSRSWHFHSKSFPLISSPEHLLVDCREFWERYLREGHCPASQISLTWCFLIIECGRSAANPLLHWESSDTPNDDSGWTNRASLASFITNCRYCIIIDISSYKSSSCCHLKKKKTMEWGTYFTCQAKRGIIYVPCCTKEPYTNHMEL